MTANKIYYPAFIGGKIVGVQMTIQNNSGDTVNCSPTNGVYYAFDGREYQILSLKDIQIPTGITEIHAEDKIQALIPTTDIKIMVDTAGLVDCVVNVQITWEVA